MKRLGIIVIVAGFLITGWVVFQPAKPKEPSYQGRTLMQWLIEYRKAENFPTLPNATANREAARHGSLNCLQIPFGTILGVFTILVMSRNSVRAAYERTNQDGPK